MSELLFTSPPQNTNLAAPVPERILFAEDDEDFRRMYILALQLAGYTVLEAYDGQHAVELAGECNGPIHLLISDVQMPRLDGYNLAGRLIAARSGIKVLLMLDNSDKWEDHIESVGTDLAFLQKPFSIGSLVSRVKAMLGQT
jgi:two-component system, cell cycle sensor histidine kinase and response regulator CckA